jgi:hypothetical protein
MRIFRLFVAFTLVCFALSPSVQAVVPAPDGGYPNFATAEGQNALKDLTTGAGNTALGAFTLFSTTTASFNTAVGAGALDLNTGDQNTAVGVAALLLNTGTNNTAVGVDALGLNSTGLDNTATGAFALYSNTTGNLNTADGDQTLQNNTTGFSNTAVGQNALLTNTTGGGNTAVGVRALEGAISDDNTALGINAGANVTGGGENTLLGTDAGLNLTSGGGNTYVGTGSGGSVDESGWIRIGSTGAALGGSTSKTAIGGISGADVTAASSAVFVNTSGQLGTIQSSARFKRDIDSMGKSSEVIFSLRPVTFHYKGDPKNTPCFGLIAEEVAGVNPELVLRDKEGKPFTVRYEQINAMLLNEFLKEHRAFIEERRKVEKLEATVAQQHEDFEAAVAQLKGQIQKVSAQLEVSKPAPQTVLNNQ